MSSEKITKTY